MIVKEYFGIIGLLFGLLIILSLFYNLNKNYSTYSLENNFETLSNEISFVCNYNGVDYSLNFESSQMKGLFNLTKKGVNELCLKTKDKIVCKRFRCNFMNEKSNIFFNNDSLKFKLKCLIIKENNNLLNLSCKRIYY